MIRFVIVAAVVVASVSEVRSEECFISSAPSIHRTPDGGGTLKDNKKARMLPVMLNDIGHISAIQVEFVDLPVPYDLWNGTKLFAQAAIEICDWSTNTGVECPIYTYVSAKLECTDTPYFTDWHALGVVNVWHEGIVPGATYDVRVLDATCNPNVPANYSSATGMQTADYGDTIGLGGFQFPVDYYVGISDALAGIATFTATPGRPSKSRTDLAGRCLDFAAGINDVLASLRAFQGLPYPETPSTVDPCDALCNNPDYP